MKQFVNEYVKQLKKLQKPEDLERLYRWFWKQFGQDKTRLESITAQINNDNDGSNLAGKFEVKPSLPCLGYGSMKRLLVVNANPGWHAKYNAIEEKYVTECDNGRRYFDLYSERFFEEYLRVFCRERTIRLWTSAMRFAKILNDWKKDLPEDKPRRWKLISREGVLGGWEIFPFHSTSDALTKDFENRQWLKKITIWSVAAALKMKPEVVIVASPAGTSIVNDYLLRDHPTTSGPAVGENAEVGITYRLLQNGTELFTVSSQIFSGRARHPGYERIIEKMEDLRSEWVALGNQPVDTRILNDNKAVDDLIG